MLKHGEVIESENRGNFLVVAQKVKHNMGAYTAIRIFKDRKPYTSLDLPHEVRKLANKFHDKYKSKKPEINLTSGYGFEEGDL